MTDQRLTVLRKLRLSSHSPAVIKVANWLDREGTRALTEEAHEVRVAEVRDLWRVRLQISSSKGHTLEGGPELLKTLEQMNASIKLKQSGFADSEKMGNIFFRKYGGQYVGTVFYGTHRSEGPNAG